MVDRESTTSSNGVSSSLELESPGHDKQEKRGSRRPEKPGAQSHPFDTTARSISRLAIDQTSLLSGTYWGELRTFLCVAKAGSLSRAAELLGSSHATVGREIRRLQDQMGSQLVILTKTGAQLTQKGQALTSELLRLDQRLFSITSDLRAEKGEAEGVVRLGITDGLGTFFLIPELRRLATTFPKIRVHVKSPGNFKNLRENQTDVILGFHPDPSHDMCSRPLGWLHFIPIATEAYIERMGLPTRANVRDHLFIDSEIYSAKGTWDSWQSLIRAGTVAHSCDSSISYGMMVKAGIGIGLIANYNMTEPTTRPLDLDVHVKLRLYAVALKDRLEAKPVRVIFDLLEKTFGPRNPWFQEEMVLSVDDPYYREGHVILFNLREHP
jgi:DNA-binding transcriptional LysR family regulator